MPCPDENVVAEFSEGLLSAAQGRALEDHVDQCGRCRSLLVAVARSSRGDQPGAGPAIEIGTILAEKYRVERVIGSGGMGVVLEATHLLLDRTVAVKLMHVDALGSPEATERFMREARAASRLESEHAARVMDLGILPNGAPFIVMEHLAGEDASRFVARAGPLDAATAALYVMQACDAVAEAHRRGIVHRDLKPSNLFITHSADGSPRIKVVDFGLSKVASERELSLTHSHAVLGSPFFMAPEQLLSARGADSRADLWALGATLHFLLAGSPPFGAASLPELSAAVLRDAPQPLPSSVPPGLAQVVARCLEKEPAKRIGSASELAAALEPFADSKVRRAIGRTTQTPRKRPRIPLFILFPVALAVIAIATFLALRRGGSAATPTVARPQPIVLLLDTPVVHGVYTPDSTPAGGTNADVISDVLGDLPVTFVKESLGSRWDRETSVLKLHPDLVVIHRSALFHALNEDFKLGYPANPNEQVDKVWLRLYDVADDKLVETLGLIATVHPETRFIVYSRGTDGRWPSADYRKKWVVDAVNRFPALEGHVTTMLVAGGVEGGSFRNPAVSNELRDDIKSVLRLH